MTKRQKTVSVPLKFYEDMTKIFDDFKDVCEQLQISSPSELVRVLAGLGKERFLGIVEEVRKGSKKSRMATQRQSK